MEQDKIQILELFGGIGSPRCALRNIGVPVKAIDYVEIDEKAVRSYNAMFKAELPYETQSVVGWNLRPDILIHGSPCQDFSIAGHQRGADEGSETRSSLMWETIHIIQQMGEWQPRYVIWENVKNVTSKHMRANLTDTLAKWKSWDTKTVTSCWTRVSLDYHRRGREFLQYQYLTASLLALTTLYARLCRILTTIY